MEAEERRELGELMGIESVDLRLYDGIKETKEKVVVRRWRRDRGRGVTLVGSAFQERWKNRGFSSSLVGFTVREVFVYSSEWVRPQDRELYTLLLSSLL